MNPRLPDQFASIRQGVLENKLPKPYLGELEAIWHQYLEQLRELVPNVYIEEDGESVYLGQLSPGCRSCKNGTWDCIFLSNACNLACSFCCSPQNIPQDYRGSAFGETIEQIHSNYQKTDIQGISFSGGEPFQDKAILFQWFSAFTERFPEKYYWVYTNGLLVEEDDLKRLSVAGLDEIRFNTDATGYNHPLVLRNLELAARHLPIVTVEIPAIPWHRKKLISSLKLWSDCGVQILNLHELMYEPGTKAASLKGKRIPFVTLDGHFTEVAPVSRFLTLAVMKFVSNERLPLSVNDCSMQSKLRQLRGRKRSLIPLTKQHYELACADGTYLTTYVSLEGEEGFFVHPDLYGENRSTMTGGRAYNVKRSQPLSLTDPGRWLSVEEI